MEGASVVVVNIVGVVVDVDDVVDVSVDVVVVVVDVVVVGVVVVLVVGTGVLVVVVTEKKKEFIADTFYSEDIQQQFGKSKSVQRYDVLLALI